MSPKSEDALLRGCQAWTLFSSAFVAEVKSAMFSFDGLRIITASMDGTAREKSSV